jgi:membrane-bound metal-dependent hydrolase YbcI (DUF457 family)
MDLFSHAIAGAAMGAAFGRPLVGAVCACLPDMVLGLKRVASPTAAYTVTHSLVFCLIAATVGVWVGLGPVVGLAVLSHLLLDLPTHGKAWAPALLYPFSERRFSFGGEWEFFNRYWFIGLIMTVEWSALWALLQLV